jgi:hypothetical protein
MHGALGQTEQKTPAVALYETRIPVPGHVRVSAEYLLFIGFHDYYGLGAVVADLVEQFLVEGVLVGFVEQF